MKKQKKPTRIKILIFLIEFLLRIFNPKDLHVIMARLPANASDEMIADFIKMTTMSLIIKLSAAKKTNAPEQQEKKECDCPSCTLNRIKQTGEVHLKNDTLKDYYKMCIKDEDYILAGILKKEADKRMLKLEA